MIKSDFKTYCINNFTPKEIEETGAFLSSVEVSTFVFLQKFRELSKRKVKLLYNGLTTGKHNSKEHGKGKAVDCYYDPSDGNVDFKAAFYKAFESGFSGVGIYYCKESNLYSFHFDMGRIRCWCATKIKRRDRWAYGSLLIDPKKLIA